MSDQEPKITIRVRLSTVHAAMDVLRPDRPDAAEELLELLREAAWRGLLPNDPELCPECGQRGRRDVIDAGTWSNPHRTIPGRLECRTPGCRNAGSRL